MQFVHALDAIFEFTAVVRKLLSHLIDAARHVATERGPDGDNLADFACGRPSVPRPRPFDGVAHLDLHSTLEALGQKRKTTYDVA